MVTIRFKALQIGEISQSSGVFSGDNLQVGWETKSKDNQGGGSYTGDRNLILDNRHQVEDHDWVDFIIRKSDEVPSVIIDKGKKNSDG